MSSWDDAVEQQSQGPEYMVATVVRSYFAPNTRYNADATVLNWVLDVTEPFTGDREELYSLGDGWESTDAGKSVTNLAGKTKFKASSIYGKILAQVPEWGISEFLASRGEINEAHVWEGLRFRFERVAGLNFNDPTKTRLMPARYLGYVNDDGTFVESGNTAPEAAPSLSPEELREQVVQAAKDANDFSAFVETATNIPGVSEDDNLFAEVVDESKIWTQVKGA